MSAREVWRALVRAWGLTWRFFDRPDYHLEIRPRPGDPWISLHRPSSFRLHHFMVAPATVDKMWCEGRVRALVELASAQGTLSGAQYRDLGEQLARRCELAGFCLPAKGWSLRSVGAMDQELCLEIHGPTGERPSC